MKVTDLTRDVLRIRRGRRDLIAAGYERVEENGYPLGQLARGGRQHCKIIDARVCPSGKTIFVRIQ